MVGAVLIGDTDLEVGACSDGDVKSQNQSVFFLFFGRRLLKI